MEENDLHARLSVLEARFNDYASHQSDNQRLLAKELESKAMELNRRLDEMNQFREQIADERGVFVTREQYEERYEVLSKRVSLIELADSNLQGRIYMIGAVISVIVSLVVVAVNFIAKTWK